MKVERFISCFDRETEELISEYNIDHIKLETIKDIIQRKRDPLMYRAYTLRKKEIEMFKKLLNLDINVDFRKYIYQLDCFQV